MRDLLLPQETAPIQLLSALQTFLAATKPSRYIEYRWVKLLFLPPARLAPPCRCPVPIRARSPRPMGSVMH
jgi:hypothetical protein